MISTSFPFFSRHLPVLLLLLAPVAVAGAGLTQPQISAALDSPAGFVWTLGGPDPAAWSIVPEGLAVPRSTPTGGVCSVSTQVTGPGIITLSKSRETYSSEAFDFSVWVDGVQSGENVDKRLPKVAVEVGPGSHEVVWKAARNSSTSSLPDPVVFYKAAWEPFSEVPLQAAAGSADIVLSTEGPHPWKGQDKWHHGDGSAAWSGLRTSLSSAELPLVESQLKASFSGPGILSFQSRNRYNNYGIGAYFELDGKYFPMAGGANNVWARTLILVGPGSHVATWTNDVPGSARITSDFAVDEIQLLPDLDFSTAVGTPGIVWEKRQTGSSQQLPFAVAGPLAIGGSLGVLPKLTTIATHITGPAMIIVKHTGGLQFEVDGSQGESDLVDEPRVAPWWRTAYEVPAGEHEITFSNEYGDGPTWIDQIDIHDAPKTLDGVFGLPAGSITSEGGKWSLRPELRLGSYIASAEFSTAMPEAWFDLPVTGPAAISFSLLDNGGWKTLTLKMDGLPAAVWGAEGVANNFKLEVPAGQHVIRWLARMPEGTGGSPSSYSAEIYNLRVAPVSKPDSLMAALGDGFPVFVEGPWRITKAISGAENGTAVQPDFSAEEDASGVGAVIQAGFKGPGYLDFKWYAREADSLSAGWIELATTDNNDRLEFRAEKHSGWREERIWLPPGPQAVRWKFGAGSSEQYAMLALDAVKFTPSKVVSVEKALGNPSLHWGNNPESKWIGALRDTPAEGVVTSPRLTGNGRTRFDTTLFGPGRLTFSWKNVGGRAGGAAFRVNDKTVAILSVSEVPRTVSINVPGISPVLAEWQVWCKSNYYRTNPRIEISGVKWEPFSETDLAGSLDTEPGVRWKTSKDHPFKGRMIPGATNGSAAYIALKSGETSWLEATVDGPGLFDFWFRKVAGMNLAARLWDYWELSIDGRTIAMSGTSWPAIFIAGEGRHRIRLTFHNPADSGRKLLATAVDEVSWIPASPLSLAEASGLKHAKFKTAGKAKAAGYSSMGHDGGPAVLLPLLPGGSSLEVPVVGPCELSWDSQMDTYMYALYGGGYVQIDGGGDIAVEPHGWKRLRLTVPKGQHVITWRGNPSFTWREGRGPDLYWKFGNMRITPLKDANGASGPAAAQLSLQAVADDPQVPSPAGSYAEWARNRNIPSSLAAGDGDADGDGATNFLEYAFGTSPLESDSRPPSLELVMTAGETGELHPVLKIPYLAPAVSGVLQSSTDLSHWEDETTPSLHAPPPGLTLQEAGSTGIYQVVALPAAGARKYYRIWVSEDPQD